MMKTATVFLITASFCWVGFDAEARNKTKKSAKDHTHKERVHKRAKTKCDAGDKSCGKKIEKNFRDRKENVQGKISENCEAGDSACANRVSDKAKNKTKKRIKKRQIKNNTDLDS